MIMALTSLPLEVMEKILLHLESKDLWTMCETFNIEVNDYFWMQVCKREGYDRQPENNHSWLAVFQLNNHWASNKYFKREYKFDSIQSTEVQYSIHGHNLLVQLDHISVWNVEESPYLVQTLKAQYLTSAGTKILTTDSDDMNIYSVCNKMYKELIKIKAPSSIVLLSDFCMTDDFFAAFDYSHGRIKIVDLHNLDIFYSNKQLNHHLSLTILHEIVYVMILKENKYIMTRFDLVKKVELDDIILFPDAHMIVLPEVRSSSNLMVGWTYESETNSSCRLAPIKVWNTNGELLRVLSIDFLTSFGTRRVIERHSILWLIVKGDYLILSTSETRIIIWCSTEPEICKEIFKDEEDYNGQKTVSSTLLVLSYTHCFKVVDLKKATYLYEVYTDSPDLMFLYRYFFTSNYYYAILQGNIGLDIEN